MGKLHTTYTCIIPAGAKHTHPFILRSPVAFYQIQTSELLKFSGEIFGSGSLEPRSSNVPLVTGEILRARDITVDGEKTLNTAPIAFAGAGSIEIIVKNDGAIAATYQIDIVEMSGA